MNSVTSDELACGRKQRTGSIGVVRLPCKSVWEGLPCTPCIVVLPQNAFNTALQKHIQDIIGFNSVAPVLKQTSFR